MITIAAIPPINEELVSNGSGGMAISGSGQLPLEVRRGPSHGGDIQNMNIIEIIGVAFSAAPENDEPAVGEDGGGVAFAGCGGNARAMGPGPFAGAQVEDVEVVDLGGAVDASEDEHLMADHGGGVAVAGAGLEAGGGEGSPEHGVEVEREDVAEMETPTATLFG